MQTESLGKLLPRVFLPYAQQWAERSGMPFLSKLLVDEHLRALIERYGEELLERLSQAERAQPKGNGKANGSKRPLGDGAAEPVEEDAALSELHDRLRAVEARYELLLGALDSVRTKMRPLAASLGCCPECLVGAAGCHKCLGKSKVAYYEPDTALLRSAVVDPLTARGVPITLSEPAPKPRRRTSEEPPVTRTRSKQWPRK